MIKVIHTADIHFGMENYGKIDSKTGIHSRLLDFERALNHCIDYALEQKADLFLFSGDAYKTTNPSPTQQKLLMRCLLRLHEAGIPVVIVVGNHDNPLSFGKANSLEIFSEVPLKNFYVIDKPRLIRLETERGPLQIVGIPWPTRNTISINEKHIFQNTEEITSYISQAVTEIIKDFSQKLDPTIPSILAGHLTVSSGIFSGSEKRAIYGNDPTFLPSQLAIEPFDYVALGHLHRYQNLNQHGYPAVVYSGSIERVDFGERKEPKGFCCVNVGRKNTTHQFIELPTRPFIQIEAHLSSDPDLHTEELSSEIKKHKLEEAVLKILYHIPAGIKDGVDMQKIERLCSNALYIVGIVPIHTHHTREKRIGLKVDMDLQSLLNLYFEEHPELRDKKELLSQKALEIYNQSITQEEMES